MHETSGSTLKRLESNKRNTYSSLRFSNHHSNSFLFNKNSLHSSLFCFVYTKPEKNQLIHWAGVGRRRKGNALFLPRSTPAATFLLLFAQCPHASFVLAHTWLQETETTATQALRKQNIPMHPEKWGGGGGGEVT